MNIIIIIEGPDGAGKTSLLWKLHEDTDIPMHERAVRDKTGPDARDLWEWTHQDMASWADTVYLYDRHPLISEYIYGPVTRGKVAEGFDRPSAHSLRRRLEDMCLLVLCLPPYPTTVENIAKDEQMEGVAENHSQLYGLYASLKTTWSGWHRVYDYTTPLSYEKTLMAVRMHAAQWRTRS